MSRYFAKPTCKKSLQVAAVDWWDAPPMISNVTVSDHDAIDTGLVDQHGDQIMRAPNPCGFGRDGEW